MNKANHMPAPRTILRTPLLNWKVVLLPILILRGRLGSGAMTCLHYRLMEQKVLLLQGYGNVISSITETRQDLYGIPTFRSPSIFLTGGQRCRSRRVMITLLKCS